jgi:hypothetical protein
MMMEYIFWPTTGEWLEMDKMDSVAVMSFGSVNALLAENTIYAHNMLGAVRN